jgi:SAM-dependent methyltransferase
VSEGCRLCGHPDPRPVGSFNGFRVVTCAACGHGAVDPVPDATTLAAICEDDAYYRGGHGGGIGFGDYRALAGARRRMFEQHLARLRPRVPMGTVLDVGCATGDFLKAAREQGWKVLGVDPSGAGADAEHAGIPLVGGTVHEAAVEPGSLDLVTFWDVLEHVADPVVDLRRARELPRPGGVVGLTVPDRSSVLAAVSGRRWFGYRTAGEHLQFFTRRSLRRALEAAGFEVGLVRPVAWSCSVAFLADRVGLYLGRPGRLAQSALRPLRRAFIDMPQINQLAVGLAPAEVSRLPSPAA